MKLDRTRVISGLWAIVAALVSGAAAQAAPFVLKDQGTGGIILKIDFVLSRTAFPASNTYHVTCGLDVQFQGGAPTDNASGFSGPIPGGSSGTCTAALEFNFPCSGSGTFQVGEQYEIQVFSDNGQVRDRHESIYLPGIAYPTWHCTNQNPVTTIVYHVTL